MYSLTPGEAHGLTIENMWHKRLLIESGQLSTWERRGTSDYRRQQWSVRGAMLRAFLACTGLRSLGERNARQAVVRDLHFTFDTLPASFHGFTILHLSDIHADGLSGLADSLCARLRHVRVDLCVLTGDYRYRVHGACDQVYTHMERILGAVQARYGIVGVLGNHDAAEKVAALEQMGVKMLVNQAHELCHEGNSMWLVGLDDPHYYGCDDLPGAMRDVPADAFKILLVHTPELFAEAAEHGVHLYLCGHTHGGQICVPGIGPLITGAMCPRRYARGVWQHHNMHGVTSAGVGVSIVPVRFFCPPEIGLITLHRGNKASFIPQ